MITHVLMQAYCYFCSLNISQILTGFVEILKFSLIVALRCESHIIINANNNNFFLWLASFSRLSAKL